ncbi:AraC family transcriptional regulator [Gordonia spumicola]|uniref:AraC family transcriptional regulator n=1 Tax=Gordonia spumicola TaxID=589161 RepID=A0A7I9V4W3_9ACTN|nr:helix-turn-helix domain-containing protein [Gordonia spumicola]GEE00277.1 AraC family transcriptional regulator [Gordonia spumicola]
MEFRDVRGLTARLSRAGVRVVPYDVVGTRPGVHLGLPSPTVTVVIDLRDGLLLTGPGLDGPTSFRCGIGGLHMSPFVIHHDGVQRGVQLSLTPGAVRRLFDVPVRALGPSTFEVADVDQSFAARLVDAAATGAIGSVLAERLSDSWTGVDPDAVRAWRDIVRTGGRVSVSHLVERSGRSARRLTGVFTSEFGIGPKQAARLVRFDAARHALEAGTPACDVAATGGYADQAHLSREFVDFTGLPPSRFLQNRRAEFA